MQIIEEASSPGSRIPPQSPGHNECHGRHHPSGSSPHAPSAAIPFKQVVHIHTTFVLRGLPQLQVLLWWTDIHNIRQGKILHLPRTRHCAQTVLGRDGGASLNAVHLVHGEWDQETLARRNINWLELKASDRSLPSDVGSQIGDDPHGQHSVRTSIQSEEGGRNSLSGAVLHSLGHSHEMSESPDPPSCPVSEGDDERSGRQVEQREQSHPHGVVYRQQHLPSHYQTTRMSAEMSTFLPHASTRNCQYSSARVRIHKL